MKNPWIVRLPAVFCPHLIHSLLVWTAQTIPIAVRSRLKHHLRVSLGAAGRSLRVRNDSCLTTEIAGREAAIVRAPLLRVYPSLAVSMLSHDCITAVVCAA
jgi:hypothetical protein